MNPELNREYTEPDEDKLAEEMVRLAVERMMPQQGRIRRGQHAKPTACVRGVFTVQDDFASDFRHGVFQPNQSFRAIVRFSNSSETIAPDGKGDARGMAIKLLDVEGTPNRCQDFFTVNHPVFPFAAPAEHVRFFRIRRTPFVGDLLAAAWLALFHSRHLQIVEAIRGKLVACPLGLRYWSGSPNRLGPPGTAGGLAVKYSLVPRAEGTAQPNDPPDYLSRAVEGT